MSDTENNTPSFKSALITLSPAILSIAASIVLAKTPPKTPEESAASASLEDALFQLAAQELVQRGIIKDENLPRNLVFQTVSDLVRKQYPDLHQKVCVEMEYCKKRADWSGEGAVIAYFAGLATDVFATLGLATLLWLFASGFFNELCEC